jgi:SatD family (SatD)
MRASASERVFAVITADVIGSRRIEGFRRKRDQKLRPLSRIHVREKLILSDYAVTAWDEFQAILRNPSMAPRVVLDLRRRFYPMQLWIAVGIGRVSEPHKKPVNLFAGGEAFERARMAADQLKTDKTGKDHRLTSFISGDAMFDLTANTIYRLHDTLLRGVSAKQWETVLAQVSTGSQELAAKKLQVNISTVSRNLRRAHFWETEETCQAMASIIQNYFSLAR